MTQPYAFTQTADTQQAKASPQGGFVQVIFSSTSIWIGKGLLLNW
jgi:hypothetical protein